jgi:hypothetical protein
VKDNQLNTRPRPRRHFAEGAWRCVLAVPLGSRVGGACGVPARASETPDGVTTKGLPNPLIL